MRNQTKDLMNTPDLFPVTAASLTVRRLQPGHDPESDPGREGYEPQERDEGQFPITSTSLQGYGDNPIGATYSSEGLRNTLKVYMEIRSFRGTLTIRTRWTQPRH